MYYVKGCKVVLKDGSHGKILGTTEDGYFVEIGGLGWLVPEDQISDCETEKHYEIENGIYVGLGKTSLFKKDKLTFKDICHELMTTYSMKNSDYGDSFGKTFEEWGLVSAVVRIADKYNRISQLAKSERKVDESIEDTLLDLAGYCIMTVMELRKGK